VKDCVHPTRGIEEDEREDRQRTASAHPCEIEANEAAMWSSSMKTTCDASTVATPGGTLLERG
jgi:hypothetical protein